MRRVYPAFSAPRPLSALLALAACCLAGFAWPELPEDWRSIKPRRLERKAEALADFQAQRDAAHLTAARQAWEEGDDPSCLEFLDGILQRQPGHAEATLLAAKVHTSAGHPEQATVDLRQAVELAPDDLELRSALAANLLACGETVAGHQQVVIVLRNDRGPSALVRQTVESLRLGRTATAVAVMTAATEEQPKSARLWRVLGAAQLADRNPAGAEKSLLRSRDLDSQAQLTYLLLGTACLKLGRSADAARYQQQARQVESRPVATASR